MKSYTYKTRGICSREIKFCIEDGVVADIDILGGCEGNIQALINLVKGMKVDEVIKKLKGIDCEGKGTSCPDQLARALERAREQE